MSSGTGWPCASYIFDMLLPERPATASISAIMEWLWAKRIDNHYSSDFETATVISYLEDSSDTSACWGLGFQPENGRYINIQSTARVKASLQLWVGAVYLLSLTSCLLENVHCVCRWILISGIWSLLPSSAIKVDQIQGAEVPPPWHLHIFLPISL